MDRASLGRCGKAAWGSRGIGRAWRLAAGQSRRWLAAAALLAAPGVGWGADIFWGGAQYVPGPGYPAAWPAAGSFFDSDNWLEGAVPDADDTASFGAVMRLPNGNTSQGPHTVYFGNFGYCGTTMIGGYDRRLAGVTVVKGDWIFSSGSGQNPDYSLPSGAFMPTSISKLIVGSLRLAPATGDSTSLKFGGTLTVGTLEVDGHGGRSLFTVASGLLSIFNATIGVCGTGSFVQMGGTITSSVYLGASSTATGVYTLSAGQLDGYTSIGLSGRGTFTQTGGTHYGEICIGRNPGSIGTYVLSGGQCSSPDGATVGQSGRGVYIQSGGTNTLSGAFTTLNLGNDTGSAGTYVLSGGRLAVSRAVHVGYSGSGVFVQSGGTHTLSSSWSESARLYLGYEAGSTGTYNLSGGQLTALGAFVGEEGAGQFIQTGGTHTVGTVGLALGHASGGVGIYKLSAGTLTVAAAESVGAAGNGTFSQTGGTHTISGLLSIGNQGVYRITGGSLQLNGGADNAGSLVLGGTVTVGVSGVVDLGRATLQDLSHVRLTLGANSLLILPAGTAPSAFGAFTNNGGMVASVGNVTVPAGTTVTWSVGSCYQPVLCAGTLTAQAQLLGGMQVQGNAASVSLGILREDSTASGISGGQLNVNAEYVGYSGSGRFTQSGGTHTPSSLRLGYQAGAIGSYLLNGGTLRSGNEYVGDSGTGIFTQSGGSHTVSGSLCVGYVAGSNGTLAMEGGTLSTFFLAVGAAGSAAGTIYQTGGVIRETVGYYVPEWRIGGLSNHDGAAVGVYNLAGGTLTTQTNFQVGAYGTGTFNQSGGTFTVGRWTSIGRFYSGRGQVNVLGGILTHTGFGHLIVGEEGEGVLTISGTGVVQLASTLYMNYSATHGGTLNLNTGGTLIAPGFHVVATTPHAYVNFDGGTLVANASSATYMEGLSNARILSGGARIDTNGYSITIGQSLQEDADSRGGKLIKLGAGTLTLTGTDNHVDGLLVAGGNLTLASALKVNLTAATPGTPEMAVEIAAGGLTLGAGGVLDITNHDVILHYEPGKGAETLAAVMGWIGSGQLMSSELGEGLSLGCVDNAALPVPYTSFDGIGLADANEILVTFTYAGGAPVALEAGAAGPAGAGVPEPGSLALLGMGVGLLAGRRRRWVT